MSENLYKKFKENNPEPLGWHPLPNLFLLGLWVFQDKKHFLPVCWTLGALLALEIVAEAERDPELSPAHWIGHFVVYPIFSHLLHGSH